MADRSVPKSPMVLVSAPSSIRAEEFRQLRTNLRFLQTDRQHKAFVVTSSVPGEGKSTTSANLAAAIAAAGSRVCLVEADLRRPSLGRILDLEDGVGLTTILAGDADLDDVLQPWGEDGLVVLLAGEIPPNPSELLSSEHAESILREVVDRFDVTIIDSPPLNPVTDASILARLFGGAVLVVGSKKVELRELRRAVERMSLVDAEVLGTVLCMAPSSVMSRYRHSYASHATPIRPHADDDEPDETDADTDEISPDLAEPDMTGSTKRGGASGSGVSAGQRPKQ